MSETPSHELCRNGEHDIDLYATNREYKTYMCMLCGLRMDYPRNYETVSDVLGGGEEEVKLSEMRTHREVVEEDFARDPEYKKEWERVAAGEMFMVRVQTGFGLAVGVLLGIALVRRLIRR